MRRPELAERQDSDPAIKPICVLAGIQDDGLLQPRPEAVLQEPESAQVFAADTGASLDLEGNNLAVVALKHEIHLLARFATEVSGRHRRIRPADLLVDFPDRERLKEMTVLGQGCGRRLCDLLRGEIEQPGHHSRIDHVHLGMLDDPGAEGRAPCREPVNEEDGLKELDVVLRCRPV